ncbi:TonB-dependent receptor [Mucilaginibacter robiniae]|uniref:TonB-dependent receptor n=1 Tax=Mucilaginibacter robiniae TaxID=2728022 RepID=A0A7L5DZ56_9SPHI|nr:TonB-dependent receptor [Mucilaginibacter robiniae]QJD96380.1 TonB-dependent receptor [Mucilaginibacter robiniae]
MNFSLLKRIALVLLLLFAVKVNAQTTASGGTVSGKLIDATTNKALDFATVGLFNKADNTPVKSMQTDLDGNFKLTGIKNGLYLLRISFVSYLTYTKDSITINGSHPSVQLGSIRMREAKSALKEVVVTGQRSQMRITADKKVFNVEQSLVSQGGTATDLLANVPSVQVDVDGNVALRGSSNVRILINGKPSALTGANLSDVLQSIPASSIENIEVITNPSAKYDAEGQSGIINIVLKKNAQLGFNGSVNAGVGNRNTRTGSANLAYQNKAINVYSNYSYRHGDRIGNGTTNTTNYLLDGSKLFQDQVADQKFTFNSHNIRSGIDVNLDQKTTLSFTNNVNIRNIQRYQTGYTEVRNENGSPNQNFTRNNYSKGPGHNLDFNLDLDKKFKKPQEQLTANIGYSTSNNHNTDNLNTDYQYFVPTTSFYNAGQLNNTLGKQHNLNLQADYTLPLSNNNHLELGYRSTFNKNSNNYLVDTLNNILGAYVPSDTLSNDFVYNEQVHAVYGNYQQQLGNFGIQAGLRLEDARIRTTTTSVGQAQVFKQDYFRVYPSVFLTDKLSESQTLQLSYSRRVSRPRDRQISPFLDRSDRQNYQQGNPNLKPEDTHSFELSYINYYKALTLTSSLYYRLTNDNIQQVRGLENSTGTITLTRFENLKSASNAGYELIAKVSPSNKFDLTGNLNVYYRHIQGDTALHVATTSGFSFNGNITGNYKVTSKLGVQLRADYQGHQVMAQGYMKALYGLDGAIRYDVTKTLSFSLNSRDIFNTRKFKSYVLSNDGVLPYYEQNSSRRWATRMVMFSLSYRFGASTQANKRKGNRDQQQDQDVPDEGQASGNQNSNNNGPSTTTGGRGAGTNGIR